ncbi:hypothetical protein [Streptomyces sp. SID11385]|uniref:hypothetical protein n=1 Tax=Streptomyces sp. SID11385 TaxID=2706031 RepID=UPI0013CCCCDF|nr:hypothetical protein [Streptomyces sp. SID11385]NEA43755.1 hypothetical protein [Streptomyces sp. SID11385]
MTSPPPPLEQPTGRRRQPEAPTHGYALLALPRESARTRTTEPRADAPPPRRAGAWVRADAAPPPREESVRHDTYPQSPQPPRPPQSPRRHGGSRPQGHGAAAPDGQDPPLYRALLARWAERGATLPLRGDPEWERLAAPPVPWFSGPRDRAGGGR